MVKEEQLISVFNLDNINSRVVKATVDSRFIKETNSENQITGLLHTSGVSIKLNDELIINEVLYRVNKIKKEITESSTKSSYKLLNFELNKTSQFIVPLLGLTNDDIYRDRILCNAYIGYLDRDYGKYLYLLYRCHDNELFEQVESNLLELDLNIQTEYSDDSFCLLRLNIPKRFYQDVQTILQGKYSKISKEAKFCIVEYYKANKNSLIHQILYKSPDRRRMLEDVVGELPEEAELFSAFDNREIFNYGK